MYIFDDAFENCEMNELCKLDFRYLYTYISETCPLWRGGEGLNVFAVTYEPVINSLSEGWPQADSLGVSNWSY